MSNAVLVPAQILPLVEEIPTGRLVLCLVDVDSDRHVWETHRKTIEQYLGSKCRSILGESTTDRLALRTLRDECVQDDVIGIVALDTNAANVARDDLLQQEVDYSFLVYNGHTGIVVELGKCRTVFPVPRTSAMLIPRSF